MISKFEFSYEIFSSYAELDAVDRQLYDFSKSKLTNAYAPYSNFPVVASALMTNGNTYFACNQENASYPMCTCAEQALLSYIGSNFPKESIEKIGVLTTTKGPVTIPDSPCGACRQMLIEHERRQQRPIQLLLFSMEGRHIKLSRAAYLLPFAFDLATVF